MHYVVFWVKITVEKIELFNTKRAVSQIDAGEKVMPAHGRNAEVRSDSGNTIWRGTRVKFARMPLPSHC